MRSGLIVEVGGASPLSPLWVGNQLAPLRSKILGGIMTIQYDRPGHPTVFLKGEPLPPLSVEECGCTFCRDIMRKEKEEGYHGGLRVDGSGSKSKKYPPYCNDGMHWTGETVAEQGEDEGDHECEERVGPEGMKRRQDLWWEYDRRGITIGLVCKKCVRKKKRKYR